MKRKLMPWTSEMRLEEFEAQIDNTINLLLIGLISAMLAVLLFNIPIKEISALLTTVIAALTTVIAVSALTLCAVSTLMITIYAEKLDKKHLKRMSEVDQLSMQKDTLNQVLSLRVKNNVKAMK